MAGYHPRSQPQWQVVENQYIIKDEPDQFGSQDSGIYLEEYNISSDSGYCTSFNTSNTDDSRVECDEEKQHYDGHQANHAAYLADSTNQRKSHHGLVKIDHPNQQLVTINASTSCAAAYAAANRPFGFYGQLPVKIQPKPSQLKGITVQSQGILMNNHMVNVPYGQQPITTRLLPEDLKRRSRSRKSPLVPKVDVYQPEDVKPSQELLAARRLLEESLITGNIVSQARYARINRRLDKMRVQLAQRSSIIQSFSQKRSQQPSTSQLPPSKRARFEDKAKCSRALYQEDKRLQSGKFTWKIGIHGPHKSFNKIAVKRSGKKRRRYLNRTSIHDVSDESGDENTIS